MIDNEAAYLKSLYMENADRERLEAQRAARIGRDMQNTFSPPQRIKRCPLCNNVTEVEND